MGVGTNYDNIRDWVEEIWQYYVRKDDQLLRKVEFERFVKSIFRVTKSTYEPKDSEMNQLFNMIDLKFGKADKKSMGKFLKSLSRTQPPVYIFDEDKELGASDAEMGNNPDAPTPEQISNANK